MQNARQLLESSGDTRSTFYSSVLSSLGQLLMNSGQTVAAAKTYSEGAAVQQRNGRGGTRAYLLAQGNVQTAHFRMGEILASANLLAEIGRRQAKLANADDVSYSSLINTASVALRLRRPDPAVAKLTDVRARARAAGDQYFFQNATSELALSRLQAGRPEAEVLEPIEDMIRSYPDGMKSLPLVTLVNMSRIRIELDLRDRLVAQADQHAQELLTLIIGNKTANKRQEYFAEWLAAKAALAAGDPPRAMAHAERAVTVIAPAARGSDTSADVGEALLTLGKAQRAANMPAAAATLARAARCLENGYGADHPATREARLLNTTSDKAATTSGSP
jgi:hypothetical protein